MILVTLEPPTRDATTLAIDVEPKPQRIEPITLAPSAPPIRVERALEFVDDYPYTRLVPAPGWLVLHGDGGSDWCHHDTWRAAMDCALDRARARALGLTGRW